MSMLRRGLAGALLSVLMAGAAAAQAPMRVALVPLDDRPVCLQYPQLLAPLAHAEVVAPPLASLGQFTTPGDTDATARWLADLDLATIDALIVSVDMLAYGGLVASRVHDVDAETALARLEVLRTLRRRRPDLPIYGFSVIMRLAPTADGRNEAWREPLARWADIAADAATDTTLAAEVAQLEAHIPPAALADYKAARTRNRRVNHASLDLVADGVFTHLVLSQDDAKPRGVHVADRASLEQAIGRRSLGTRVGLQPGADEVAMLLLVRAVLAHHRLRPSMQALFSTPEARAMVAPFEDRPLHETVRFQIATAGAQPRDDDSADLDLFVFASRHEPDVPNRFAARVAEAVRRGRRVVVADVDPKGDVQGASGPFTEALLAPGVAPRLYGYASWNTAGNTIGTAIPHGLLHYAGMAIAGRCQSPAWRELPSAQLRVLVHRLVNDYAWQGMVRPRINAALRAEGQTPLRLGDATAAVEGRILAALQSHVARIGAAFSAREHRFGLTQPRWSVHVTQVGPLTLSLPWSRTFEAHLEVAVDTEVEDLPVTLPSCEAVVP